MARPSVVADTMDCELTTSTSHRPSRPDCPASACLLWLLEQPQLAAPHTCCGASILAKKCSPTPWEQLIPVCILAAILLVFLLACLKECHFKYSRRKSPEMSPKRELGPLPKITVTNGRTGEERVIQE
ncbi:unnamed protein product [Caenorhabditis sp. 36 PRJEB53466]|nr:unnamed protein product [Caenorhabditis sp. 36 PRJEB53466]